MGCDVPHQIKRKKISSAKYILMMGFKSIRPFGLRVDNIYTIRYRSLCLISLYFEIRGKDNKLKKMKKKNY